MKREDYAPLAFIQPTHNVPCTYPSLANFSSSSLSLRPNVHSHQTDDTTTGFPVSDSGTPNSSSSSDSYDSYCFSHPLNSQSSVSSLGSVCEASAKPVESWKKQLPQQTQVELPAELRQNPRRTSTSVVSRTGRTPGLVRQAERKGNFVDHLVDSSTHIVETIWPTSSVVPRNESGNNTVLPLRTFIQETLRRSRTSYSTLQVALYYLILIKPHVPECDFTKEQPNDCQTSHALQCGRRMFLAALILASKYLQDRNYSARAWSKISGLNTTEIFQNEMAFLLAVNWKLHVPDYIYNRWYEYVMKHTPSQPPSPGSSAQQAYELRCKEFRHVIMNLKPGLENLEEICPWAMDGKANGPSRGLFIPLDDRPVAFESELPATPQYMEPSLRLLSNASVRQPPALGLLPTPRLTPQSSGFSTPAVNATSCLNGKSSSMGFAIAQASYAASAHAITRPSPSISSSPQSYFARRSSLANTISTASSPESMVSDSSRISRSSSISSASSLASAPASKLDVQARYRYARQCSSDRWVLRPTIASVPEDYEENRLTASPEMYTGTVNKGDVEIPMQFANRQREIDDAARALQELQRYGTHQTSELTVATGSKRSRSESVSTENSLQGNVRELLVDGYSGCEPAWSDALVRRSRPVARGQSQLQVPVPSAVRAPKRMCCSTEAAAESYMISSLHPAMGGLGGPGMWEGILH